VSVGASWEQGYVASVAVQNTGSSAASWTVTVSHRNLDDLRLLYTWGAARGTQSGDNVIFTGGPLAAGASVNFGYQVGKSGRGNARPAGCTVVGGACGVS
jgi:cellulase/cellobiase CelA1